MLIHLTHYVNHARLTAKTVCPYLFVSAVLQIRAFTAILAMIDAQEEPIRPQGYASIAFFLTKTAYHKHIA